MSISGNSFNRTVGKRAQLSDNQRVLSLIASEREKGNITEAQAAVLQRQAIAMIFTEYLQHTFEPSCEALVDQMQRKLENSFDDLMKSLLQQMERK